VSNDLIRFVTESNRIEGINFRSPLGREVQAHEDLFDGPLSVANIERFVTVCAGALLRRRPGMDVRVGNHVPPPGSPEIETTLRDLLLAAEGGDHPYEVHVAYETLHPFMDGNGRSGRAIWAWQMINQCFEPGIKLGFLHAYYYQSLDRSR
jgi:hypothetical protein